MKHFILAHDLGTTGNKATLYDPQGQLVGSAFYGYSTEYAHTSWAEQDPGDWWQAVCASTRQLIANSGIRPAEIACVTFSGQMMGCLPVDARGRPLRKSIIWADQRAVPQQNWLAERIAAEQVYQITGHRLSASYSLCKMLWLRDHQAEVFRAAHKFLHAKDYIVSKLTGAFVSEPSDASGMNLMDIRQGSWSEVILQAAQVDADVLPQIVRSIDVVGTVLPEAAAETGVPVGTPEVIGGGDGACAAAGAGSVQEGSAYNYLGSSAWISLTTVQPIFDPQYRTFTFGHIIPGCVTPTGTMQAAGASYQWLRDQLCAAEVETARAQGGSPYELMNREASKSPPGANGLLFLPYLMGERSPRWNPRARGAFLGLTIRHTRPDMMRAVLEGVTFNMRVILDAFSAQGAQIEAMRVIGGGASGRFWNRILADIYGLPVHRLAILEEATSMGAALAGGVGIGLYPDFTLGEQMNRVVEVIDPDPAAQAVYQRSYAIFEAAYHALAPIYDQMAG